MISSLINDWSRLDFVEYISICLKFQLMELATFVACVLVGKIFCAGRLDLQKPALAGRPTAILDLLTRLF